MLKKSNFEIVPAPITIEDFKKQIEKVSDENKEFIINDIEFYPGVPSYHNPTFEVIDGFIDACFIRLSDGWVSVPLAESYSYGNWYHCTVKKITKERIRSVERNLQISFERKYIKDSEVIAMQYMIDEIELSEN